jgi:hypothetical protein
VYKSRTIILEVTLLLGVHHIIVNSIQHDSGAEKNFVHR